MSTYDEKERSTLLSFASRVDRNDPGALNNLGVLYYRKGMYEEALDQFKQAIMIDSKCDLARENIQHVYRTTNIEDPDIHQWKEQVAGAPDNLSYRLNLGVSYYNVGQLDEAEGLLRDIVEADPSHCMARIRLGNILKSRGRYREALEHYSHIIEEIGDHPVYYTDLGEIYYNLGRTQDAISALKKAMNIDNGYWRPHLLMSFAYGDEGKTEDANRERDIASQLNPYSRNTEANLSLAEDRKDLQGECNRSLEEELKESECTALLLGKAYRERGYYKEALKEFELALIETPNDEELHMELVKLYLACDRFEDAFELLARTLDANPNSSKAYDIMGLEHHLRGNTREAVACYARAYYINAANADTMNNLGVVMYQCGLREDAEQMFRRGLNCDIYHGQLHSNILTASILKEDYATAETCLRQFQMCVGEVPSFYEKRALLNFKMDKIGESIADIEATIAGGEDRSDAMYLRGLIHLREENFKDAIATIVAASRVADHFAGYDLLLACEHRPRSKALAVPATANDAPGDEVIDMLRAASKHELDDVQNLVTKIIEGAPSVADWDADHVEGRTDVEGGDQTDEDGKTETGFEELEQMIEQLKQS